MSQFGVVVLQMQRSINAIVTVKLGVIHSGDDHKAEGLFFVRSGKRFESSLWPRFHVVGSGTDSGRTNISGSRGEFREMGPSDKISIRFRFNQLFVAFR